MAGGNLSESLPPSLTDSSIHLSRNLYTSNANANTKNNVAMETEPAIAIFLIGLDFGLVGRPGLMELVGERVRFCGSGPG